MGDVEVLSWAALRGDVVTVARVLDHKPELIEASGGPLRGTALETAVVWGQAEAVRLLVGRGARLGRR